MLRSIICFPIRMLPEAVTVTVASTTRLFFDDDPFPSEANIRVTVNVLRGTFGIDEHPEVTVIRENAVSMIIGAPVDRVLFFMRGSYRKQINVVTSFYWGASISFYIRTRIMYITSF